MKLFFAILLFTALPGVSAAEAPGERRTAPEASDVALFLVAAGAVFATRRALRRRLPRQD